MNNLSRGITALIAGAALAMISVVPANAISINWPPYTNCTGTKVIKTTSYGRYAVSHKVETGGGAYIYNFSNGSMPATNTRSTWGISMGFGGNASGISLSTASLSCV